MNVVKIYFDMDGVLADFNGGLIRLCDVEPEDQMHQTEAGTNAIWDGVRSVEHFYDKLEVLPGADEMFRRVYEKYGDRCEILTGIPKPKRQIADAGEDKIKWTHRLLSPDVKVNIVYREQKKDFCVGKGSILIDDLKSNIDAWEAYGGTGILHKDAEETMAILERMGVL